MTARKAIALAGLVLALAILSPASALADAGGTTRPVKGTVSGTAALNLVTGNFAVDVGGAATHIGKYTAHSEGTSVIDFATGTLVASGITTVVAADGDQLTGTFQASTADTPAGHTATQVMTITGGTGRFADASGSLTITVVSQSFTLIGDTVVRHDEGTTSGEISY
jgi:hypothetical protein